MEVKNCTVSLVNKVGKNGNEFQVLHITLPTGYDFDCYEFNAVEKLKAYKSIADSVGLKLK